ncbi:ABC transporter, permease protein, putative [Pedobacter sp. BAL39]|uniref:DUF4350 domain-containing protein n=1 Tax=Pedobacter sp. BAL39 TaxID=391596 RepID=UPI0001559E5E|nr:DUF4350 domain-containing protein [Pedobacter sp. BAL39]EDM35531.1 ABC transporter, permease protein, putative [Pedobacter sp. BAL39]
MNIIFKIARTELRNLFYSPIAWFLMIVFLVQCAMTYMGMVDSNVRSQEMGGRGLEYMTQLTNRIFTGQGGLFSSVMQNLYLYIPLLTMGLISREINGGTIKLLYSSPVKVQEIVFGKYLAMLVYSLVLVAIVGIFLFAGLFHIKEVDTGILMSGALGFFLLLCAYSAIGLFMSSLTTYQVVAAVSTFVMIGILSYIGTLWQQYDFVRDLTYFLSLSGRTGHMLNGMIMTKDVIYFLIIVYIFLGLTIFKMKAGRESKPFVVKAGKYAFIIVSALAIGYASSRPGLIGYWDTTTNQSNTLTPNAQKIIKQLGKEELEITVYNNLLGQYVYAGLPEARNRYLSVWEPYLRFKPDIKFEYVNYYDSIPDDHNYFYKQYEGKNLKQIADLSAKNFRLDLSMFKTPEEIHKLIDLKPELNRFVMQLKYKDKSTFLRVYDDQQMFPSETEVSAAFKRLMSAKLPKVAFLTGNLERDIVKKGDREYQTLTTLKTFRYALVNQGFDVDTLSLESSDVPENISILVIADPKSAMSPATLAKVKAYVAKGGNLLVAGEPEKRDVLAPVLQELGVEMLEGTLVQPSKDLSPDLVLNNVTPFASTFTKMLTESFQDSTVVSTPGAVALAYHEQSGFNYHPLLMTSSGLSWLKKGKFVADSAAVVFSTANGDIRRSFPTVLALSRKINGKEQRIIVSGDADFMSNSELGRYNVKTANFIFNTALYSWLNYGEFPIDTSRPEAKDKRMKITSAGVNACKIAFIWVLPALLLAGGSVLLIRRKRK